MSTTQTPPPQYPLAAIVGQAQLLLALQLAWVDPAIGGVLVEGERGSAKSTAARGLAAVMGGGAFVNLPLGATEEMVTGTLDLGNALANGSVNFAPGLLARADGGVLYVDEVNLLADHLVDILLDAAAGGVNFVERDGISHRHPARFVLIGTMNPDEGELRPQLLDRFGLSVVTTAVQEPKLRAEVVARRRAFERNPEEFCAFFDGEQKKLAQRCSDARKLLDSVTVSDKVAQSIARRCLSEQCDGLRADLVLHKAACAHAALRGAAEVTVADVETVAELALRHRRKAGGGGVDLTGAGAGAGNGGGSVENGDGRGGDGGSGGDSDGVTVAAVAVDLGSDGDGVKHDGHGDAAGRAAGGHRRGLINWPRTLAAGRPRRREDLHYRRRMEKPGRMKLILVDASASTLRGGALRRAKGLVAALLEQARRRRERAGILRFGGGGDGVQLLRACRKVGRFEIAPELARITGGGGTPLRRALLRAAGQLRAEANRRPGERREFFLITDGRSRDRLRGLTLANAAATVVDIEGGAVRLGRCRRIARELGARLVHIDQFSAAR